jgi:hypothetical protein
MSRASWWDRFVMTLSGLGQPASGEQLEAQLDRAIRQTNEQIKKTKEERDASKAERIHAQRKSTETKAAQKALEVEASILLRGRRKAQVQVLALDISKLSEERQRWETIETQAKEHEQAKILLADVLDGQLRRLKYQLGVFRAAANLQRTQEAIARTHLDATADIVGPPVPANTGRTSLVETPEQILKRLSLGIQPAEKKPRKSKATSGKKTSTRKTK